MKRTILSLALLLIGFNFYAQQLAFPTAEGYGRFTVGGLGGDVSFRIASPSTRDNAADYGKRYVADNIVVGNSAVTVVNWNGGVQPQGEFSYITVLKLNQPWPAMPIKQQTAELAYTSVLESAGATLPKRDAIDTRIIEETRYGNATYESTQGQRS